eukprot:scaffold8332_cov19-Tisochrysis_lutea.AAC.4
MSHAIYIRPPGIGIVLHALARVKQLRVLPLFPASNCRFFAACFNLSYGAHILVIMFTFSLLGYLVTKLYFKGDELW